MTPAIDGFPSRARKSAGTMQRRQGEGVDARPQELVAARS